MWRLSSRRMRTSFGILNIDMPVLKNIAAIAKGMSITFMEMFQPTTVENYPDGKGPLRGARVEARFRGAHVLQRDENGLEKCVACFLCAAACPSNCIYIEAAENTAENRVSGAERYAKVYNIDYNRCIFCGYCVEACPTDAITHGHGFELRPSMPATWSTARSKCWPPGQRTWEPTLCSTRPTWTVGRRRRWYRGADFEKSVECMPRRSSRPAFVHVGGSLTSWPRTNMDAHRQIIKLEA